LALRNLWQLASHPDSVVYNPEESRHTAGKRSIFQSLNAPYTCNSIPDRLSRNQDQEDIAKFSLYEVNEEEVIIY